MAHWIEQFAYAENSDFQKIAEHFGISIPNLLEDVTAALDRLPRRNTNVSALSNNVLEAVERSHALGVMNFGGVIRSGYIVLGALRTPRLENELDRTSVQFSKIDDTALVAGFDRIVVGSVES